MFGKTKLRRCCVRDATMGNMFKFYILLLTFSNKQLFNILTNCEERFALSTPKDCRKINQPPSCKCAYSLGKYVVTCYGASSIIIRVRSNSLEMECNNDAIPDLPFLNIGNKNLVKISYCSLPPMDAIAKIFLQLNVTNVAKLQYKSKFNISHHHLSSLNDLTYLDLDLENSVELQSDLFEDMPKLEFLGVRTYQLELPADVFVPLKNLKHLRLALNKATELPHQIFHFDQKLTILSIGPSQITRLQKAIFANLTSLENLNLHANDIKIIESNIFDNLQNLKTLNLNSNRFEDLPNGLLAQLKNLTEFKLSNNHGPLRYLPNKFFANLPFLNVVNLNCHLKAISADVFINSTMIATINLEKNQLSTLPVSLFFHQINLIILNLGNNILRVLPENFFIQNKKLQKLTLSNNQIEQITSNIFKPLTSLVELELNGNHLVTIAANAFDGHTNLKTLNLHNNRLQLNETTMSSPFHSIKNLEVLNLGNNSLIHIFFENNFIYTSLKKLDLCNNNITVIDLNKLQQISKSKLEINLSYNKIETIIYKENQNNSNQIGNREIYLNLVNNPLNCDCKLLGILQFLSRKRTKNVYIKSKDLVCQKPANLKNKFLSNLLPEELLCSLEMYQSGCKIFEITFNQTVLIECNNRNESSMQNLKSFLNTMLWKFDVKAFEVNLERNNLKKLPDLSFIDSEKISTLKLAGNNIKEINFKDLPQNLLNLDLRNNSLQVLNSDLLEYFEKDNTNTKSLKLSGNPWRCDCSALPLLEFAQRNFKTLTDRSEMLCRFSDMIVPFDQLKISDICFDKTLIICLSILTISILIFVILTFVFMNFNMEIKIYLYSHKLCLWFVTEAELDKEKIYDAFISYSGKDEKFVVEHLVPKLENGTPPFKLCVHYRNFLVGESIPINIANAIENSKRTIIVLSKNFIESDWALHEFRSAHLAAIDEKKTRVIVILYGDIGNINALDAELQVYIKTKTYLVWDDPKFWNRLRYAMPHTNGQLNNLAMRPIQNGYAIVNGGVRS